MGNEFAPVEGIHLNDAEATRVVRAVVGEVPLSSELFAGLRRAMQLETLMTVEPFPEADLK